MAKVLAIIWPYLSNRQDAKSLHLWVRKDKYFMKLKHELSIYNDILQARNMEKLKATKFPQGVELVQWMSVNLNQYKKQ